MVLITLLLVLIFVTSLIALIVYISKKIVFNTTVITNKYAAAILDAQNKKYDKAIEEYRYLIKNFGVNNILMKDIFFRLSEMYEAKGGHFFLPALQAIDNAIKILKNKKINQNEDYIKYAYLYKYSFLKRHNRATEANELKQFLLTEYPNDKYLTKKLSL